LAGDGVTKGGVLKRLPRIIPGPAVAPAGGGVPRQATLPPLPAPTNGVSQKRWSSGDRLPRITFGPATAPAGGDVPRQATFQPR